jgi:hypothetical protein
MLEHHIAESTTAEIKSAESGSSDASEEVPVDDRTGDEIKDDDSKLYDISNFSL